MTVTHGDRRKTVTAALMGGQLAGQDESDGKKRSAVRKSNKPEMEKKRRNRMNASLQALKNLVLQAMNKDITQYSKLEKADILEMTVRHLRHTQRLHATGNGTASDLTRYTTGYLECAQQVRDFLTRGQATSEVVDRTMDHLQRCLSAATEQQQQHYHQHQLQHVQHLVHLQQQGLMELVSGTGQAHQAFLAPPGLSGYPAVHPALSLRLPPLLPSSAANLASLAAAPTAFQTPPNPKNCQMLAPAKTLYQSGLRLSVLSSAVSPSAVSGIASAAFTLPSGVTDSEGLYSSSRTAGRTLVSSPMSPSSALVSGASSPIQYDMSAVRFEKMAPRHSDLHQMPSSPVTSEWESFASSGASTPDDLPLTMRESRSQVLTPHPSGSLSPNSSHYLHHPDDVEEDVSRHAESNDLVPHVDLSPNQKVFPAQRNNQQQQLIAYSEHWRPW